MTLERGLLGYFISKRINIGLRRKNHYQGSEHCHTPRENNGSHRQKRVWKVYPVKILGQTIETKARKNIPRQQGHHQTQYKRHRKKVINFAPSTTSTRGSDSV